MQILRARFMLWKETRNTFVFSEVNPEGETLELAQALMGTIYIKKSVFGPGKPQMVEVTVTRPAVEDI